MKATKGFRFVVIGFALCIALAALCLLYILTKAPALPFPSFAEIKKTYMRSDAVLLDRHGEVIQELRVDMEGRRLDWTSLADVSPALLKAVLTSEDRRFYSHRGVDWVALASSAVEDVFAGGRRGASTITMQLADLAEKELRPAKVKDIALKIRQIRTALEIERTWKKREILEAYLDLVSFRGELQGVSAASRGMFGKDPSGLNDVESVILASLIRSPNAPAADVARRACALSAAMGLSAGKKDISELAERALSGPYRIRKPVELAFNAAAILLSKNSRRVVSSIDASVQRFAAETLEENLHMLSVQNVSDGAVLVVSNRLGEVLAYVANRGASSPALYVDGISAHRQAGSTLKPFLYGLAFDRKLLTPASLLSDEPLDLETSRGVYSPNDYDNQFKGLVPARVALASSLNVPAVRAAMLTGNGAFVRVLGRAGFEGLREGDVYGPSIALGTADVSLWELVGAYRALANGGVWDSLRMVPGGKGSAQRKTRVLSKEATFLISDILSDPQARRYTFGPDNPLATKFWSAVKTGTSKDMRDNWCIGYSRDYTVGVWVGNFSSESMWNVSGISGAAPVWLEVMNYLNRGIAFSPPAPPPGVASGSVCDDGCRKEWFISGTEPTGSHPEDWSEPSDNMQTAKITYPAEGMIIAIDPDIPPDRQKVFFEATGGASGMRWLLNGHFIGNDEMPTWTPARGDYELTLTDGQNRLLDRISFEVR
jgi:penicillin-binding protein 1C